MALRAQAWRTGQAGLCLFVRVTAKSAQDRVDGLAATEGGPALKVRVRAVAENGRANAACEEVVADWLGLAKSRVRVVQGHKSRTKMLDLAGEPGEIEALVAMRVAALH
jgi:uncharacterized protein YggU (UPF0235/DUF167 family)